MEYLDFSKEMARADINHNKKFITVYRAVLCLSIALFIFNTYSIYMSRDWIVALSDGITIANILWFLGQLSFIKDELKMDQERLTHLENLSEDNIYRGMMDQLKSTQEYYQKLVSNIVETNAPYPEKS